MSRTTAQQKREALAAYVELGTVTAACRAAGIGRRTFYDLKASDPEFAAAADAAKKEVGDCLEQEAIRRAYNGSDVLLIFLLKGHKPEKFRERIYQEIKSENKNAHSTESVSVTAGWIEGLLGTGQTKPTEKPVQDGSVLPATVRAESS